MIYRLDSGIEAQFTSLPSLEPELPAGMRLVMPVQTHTANVSIITTGNEPLQDVDAIITQRTDIAIGVRTADCQPILLYAPDIRAVAAIHAGWRGTLARIASKTVVQLGRLGADPALIRALLGPSICGKCYEVGRELVDDFRAAGFATLPSADHLDLCALNAEDLADSGVTEIRTLGHCTLHSPSPLYPSWRRTPGTTSRLISTIFIHA